jgi:hypothetical protein
MVAHTESRPDTAAVAGSVTREEARRAGEKERGDWALARGR